MGWQEVYPGLGDQGCVQSHRVQSRRGISQAVAPREGNTWLLAPGTPPPPPPVEGNMERLVCREETCVACAGVCDWVSAGGAWLSNPDASCQTVDSLSQHCPPSGTRKRGYHPPQGILGT